MPDARKIEGRRNHARAKDLAGTEDVAGAAHVQRIQQAQRTQNGQQTYGCSDQHTRQAQSYSDAPHEGVRQKLKGQTGAIHKIVLDETEGLREKAHGQTSVHGHQMEWGTVIKFAGLVAFIAIMVVAVVLCWPLIQTLFGEGGMEEVKRQVSEAGPLGMLLLLGLQFVQVVVAFIPGEVVQVVAGLLYGPWLGTAVILIGCVISSAIVFLLVHKLGAPFVRSMVPEKYMDKIHHFEEGGKLNLTVFVLFLIPGMPKDVFTYLVPLTSMRMQEFLLLSNIARIPGIFVSTYAAHGFSEGKILQSVVIFAIAAVVAIIGLLLSERIMARFEKKHARVEQGNGSSASRKRETAAQDNSDGRSSVSQKRAQSAQENKHSSTR